MLTSLAIRNFKRFDEVRVELGNPVVLIGPNNSGKSTALQALSLWELGLNRWTEKRSGKQAPRVRSGVAINRKDLIAIPVPDAHLLWRDLHVREVTRDNGKQSTSNIRIEIEVSGVTNGREWTCGLEFDYANEESLYCRPLRDSPGDEAAIDIPEEARLIRTAFLPPMSGLAATEVRLDPGAINVRIGEGRTAEVLRNLCWLVRSGDDGDTRWPQIVRRIDSLFGIRLDEPVYIPERSELVAGYRSAEGIRLDLSSAGRGLQQSLLLLTWMAANPGAVLLLDEPDAHLEVLRQRQTYHLLTEAARESGCQIIIASHSEVVLNEAADRDVVVAFVGKPHRIDDRGSQVLKSLKEIGFDQYYQAELTGWVLYLEGSTDLSILQTFARRLGHPAIAALDCPYIKYIENQPQKARDHFFGLREAKPDLVGFVLCDRLGMPAQPARGLDEYWWSRREIENYLCQPETLAAFAAEFGRDEVGPLFDGPERHRRIAAMEQCVVDHVTPAALRNRSDPWWRDVKASDDFLDRVFRSWLDRMGLPADLLRKHDYHVLAAWVPVELVDAEVGGVLDRIVAVRDRALPAT